MYGDVTSGLLHSQVVIHLWMSLYVTESRREDLLEGDLWQALTQKNRLPYYAKSTPVFPFIDINVEKIF